MDDVLKEFTNYNIICFILFLVKDKMLDFIGYIIEFYKKGLSKFDVKTPNSLWLIAMSFMFVYILINVLKFLMQSIISFIYIGILIGIQYVFYLFYQTTITDQNNSEAKI